jgi:hypothetical protein
LASSSSAWRIATLDPEFTGRVNRIVPAPV